MKPNVKETAVVTTPSKKVTLVTKDEVNTIYSLFYLERNKSPNV